MIPLSDPSLLLHSMQQQGRENQRERATENRQLKRQAIRAERDTLEQLVADGEELAPEKRAWLDDLQSAREGKNEAERLRYHAKRQKKQEEAIGQEHPIFQSSSNLYPTAL